MAVVPIHELTDNAKQFIEAVKANARQVEDWDEDFISHLLYVRKLEDGSIQVSDNFEKFFDTIYTFRVDGSVGLRWGYSDRQPEEYSFEQAMGDASIMYTG